MSSLVVCFLPLLFGLLSEGREILVGGKSNTWKVPESGEETTLNNWSERTRFKIGDSLLWKYNAENDSVMQVKAKDYERCDRSEPIRGYKDGHTKIELKRSGPYYFISGEEGHCQRGEKLTVVVLSPNHPNHNKSDSVAPVNAHVSDAAGPVKALVTNKGSDHRLNRAWSLVATACFLLLSPLGLLV